MEISFTRAALFIFRPLFEHNLFELEWKLNNAVLAAIPLILLVLDVNGKSCK